ncbi:uncharacterized protein DUF1761 [Rathayibacter sp. PhB152]|nr:uncharacterized protein DUF1761 [Rathayibacter sp. PhB152]
MNSWWVTAIAGLLYYVLGAAWFTPLFGRAWDRSIGHDRSSVGGRFPLGYYLLPLAGALITAVIITVLLPEGAGAVPGLLTGAAVGLAAATASLTNALTPHTPHPYLFGAITGGYHLTGGALVGTTVGLFA